VVRERKTWNATRRVCISHHLRASQAWLPPVGLGGGRFNLQNPRTTPPQRCRSRVFISNFGRRRCARCRAWPAF